MDEDDDPKVLGVQMAVKVVNQLLPLTIGMTGN